MPTTGVPEDVDVDAVLAAYGGWLKRQPLSVRSREAYLAQVRDLVGWLTSKTPCLPSAPTGAASATRRSPTSALGSSRRSTPTAS